MDMFSDDARSRLRKGLLLSALVAGVSLTVLGATSPAPTADAAKPSGGTATAPSLSVTPAAEGGLAVVVSGSGFSAGKRVQVDTTGPSPAPLRTVTTDASGSFSYSYAVPSAGTWTFSAYEEVRSGWKFKVKLVYVPQ